MCIISEKRLKRSIGYFGLLGAWNITNLVLDILSD